MSEFVMAGTERRTMSFFFGNNDKELETADAFALADGRHYTNPDFLITTDEARAHLDEIEQVHVSSSVVEKATPEAKDFR